MKRTLKLGLSVFTALTLGLAVGAQAQSWPDRPIRIVSAYAAGGSSDIVLRSVASKMSETLKQQVIVENKPGAGTLLATEYVAKSKPDGYTILMTGGSALSIAPHLQKDMPYKTTDVTAISLLYTIPLAIYYNPRMIPANNIAEFIAYGKKNLGKLNYGTTGRGNAGHLIGEMFEAATGVDMVDVPYKGSAAMVQDISTDQLPVMTEALVGHMQQVRAGKYRVLGVTSEKRLDIAPDVPTFAESGFPELTIASWLALFAPAGTAPEIISKINLAVKAALEDAQLSKTLGEQGAIITWSTPEELTNRVAADNKAFGDVIRRIGLKLD